MPAAVAVPIATAIIGAGGAVAGGVIASKASKHATDAQMKSNQDAIDYQKQQQAERRQRYDAAYQDYRQRYDAWLEQYFGQKAPSTGGTAHASSVDGGGATPVTFGGMASSMTPQPAMAPQSSAMPASPTMPTQAAPAMSTRPTGGTSPVTLADLNKLYDWGTYGAA